MSAATHIQRCRQWIEEQIEAMGTLRTANSRDLSFKSWRQNTVTVLQRIWPNDRERVERFRRIIFTPPHSRPDPKLTRDWFGRGIAESRTYLQSLLDTIDQEGVPPPADSDRGHGASDLEDEVGFPMLDLSDSGAVRLPEPDSGFTTTVVGDLDVTPGYTSPDEQGAVPREPVSPLPPSLQMKWRMPAAFSAKNPAGPASPAPPALGEPVAGSGTAREREERPEVEIPRAPSLPPAEKPAAPVAGQPVASVTAKPEAPVAAKPTAPPAEKPSTPVAAKPAAPAPPAPSRPAQPAAPVAAKPAPPKPAQPAAPVTPVTHVAPVSPKPSQPVAAKPVAPVTPLAPVASKPAGPVAPKPAAPPAARPVPPAPPQPVVAKPAEPALPAPAQGRVETSSSPRREAQARGKNGKAKPKKGGPKPKLKDLLGLDEFEAMTQEAEAALAHLAPAPAAGEPPAPIAPELSEPAVELPAPPASIETPATAAIEPPAPAPAATADEPERAAAIEPGEGDEPDEEDRERATLDFMQNSPVFGVVGKPVQRHTDTTEFLDPDAVAVATLAADLGRLGVPEGMKSSLGSRLLDVAKHLEDGDIEWALLRGSVTDAMQYPELARRLLPVLLPWLERAA